MGGIRTLGARMVSNGGYNGVLIALCNGVPLVVNGAQSDKPEICARVRWSGPACGLRAPGLGRSRYGQPFARFSETPGSVSAPASFKSASLPTTVRATALLYWSNWPERSGRCSVRAEGGLPGAG